MPFEHKSSIMKQLGMPHYDDFGKTPVIYFPTAARVLLILCYVSLFWFPRQTLVAFLLVFLLTYLRRRKCEARDLRKRRD